MKNKIILTIIGLILITSIITMFLNSEQISMYKDMLLIIQSVVIIFATIFTARWTMKSYGYSYRVNTLTDIRSSIYDFYHELKKFYAEIRPTNKITKEELTKRLRMGSFYNRIHRKIQNNLWLDKNIRKKLIKEASSLFTVDRIHKMIESDEILLENAERKKLWQEFESDYNNIVGIIEREISKYR